MDIYAAIDLIDGRNVRLYKGRFDQVTDYGDPVEAAVRLTSGGVAWLHVVDLNAARTGEATQRPLIAELVKAVEVPVQTGGGVRSQADVEALLALGVSRVVVGTAALEDPSVLETLARRYPGQVSVGLDHQGAPGWALAARGWEREVPLGLLSAAGLFEAGGAASLVVTSIPTDGTLQGPDLEGLAAVLGATKSVEVIASGGTGSVEDLQAVAALEVGGRRISGAIVGRAAQDGRVDLSEAARLCAR